MNNIIQGNKLIAKFDGYKYFGFNDERLQGKYPAGWKTDATTSNVSKVNAFAGKSYLCRHHKDLKYHLSWDWLMRVVEKIENLNFTFDIYTNGIKIISNDYRNLDGWVHGNIGTKKENVWNGIIKWLQWYNKEQGVEVSDTTEAK